LAYRNTHQLQITITRSANNFGPKQSAEKLIPTIIRSVLADKRIPVYGTGINVREWIYVDDHAGAILKIVEKNDPQHVVYNIGGEPHTNISLVEQVLVLLGRGEDFVEFVADRQGHDFRYSVESKLYESEFSKISFNFDHYLSETVNWYLNNPEWLKRSESKVFL
jgi:dTDP-glucose 4,6-dehydratase